MPAHALHCMSLTNLVRCLIVPDSFRDSKFRAGRNHVADGTHMLEHRLIVAAAAAAGLAALLLQRRRRAPRSPNAELMRSLEAIVFDCDGVIYRYKTALPAVPEALDALRASGKRLFFVTNAAFQSRASLAEKLNKMGIAASAEECITSASAAAAYLVKHHPGTRRAYVVGGGGLMDELRLSGIEPVGDKDVGGLDALLASGGLEADLPIDAVVVGARKPLPQRTARALDLPEAERALFEPHVWQRRRVSATPGWPRPQPMQRTVAARLSAPTQIARFQPERASCCQRAVVSCALSHTQPSASLTRSSASRGSISLGSSPVSTICIRRPR